MYAAGSEDSDESDGEEHEEAETSGTTMMMKTIHLIPMVMSNISFFDL